ncbi:MAG: hypothetical protein NT031_03840 [Planctomycetota bacterium]|nr:hypothetical protein [Planctomycetota bacterium]
MPVGLIAIFVFVAIVLVIIAAGQAGARRKAMEQWAGGRGLAFDPDRQEGFDDRFEEFSCLRQGSSRYADNVISGNWGDRAILAFDYHYTTGSGKNRHSHSFSAVILESEIELKDLMIRQETFGDKMGAFFGFDDIDFESAQFSKEFYVRASDRKWAYDVIHARTMELLLASPRFSIQMAPRRVMAWRTSRLEPAELGQAATLVAGILDGMPQYLLEQQAGPAGA